VVEAEQVEVEVDKVYGQVPNRVLLLVTRVLDQFSNTG
jgi:hypothetical protein